VTRREKRKESNVPPALCALTAVSLLACVSQGSRSGAVGGLSDFAAPLGSVTSALAAGRATVDKRPLHGHECTTCRSRSSGSGGVVLRTMEEKVSG
jgi:hypothetical protein